MTTEEQLRDQLEKAQAACAEMRQALIPFQCETCNGTHLFTFECQGCLSGEGECTCDKQRPEPCPQCQSDNGLKGIYAALEHALCSDCGSALLDELKRLREDKARLDWLNSNGASAEYIYEEGRPSSTVSVIRLNDWGVQELPNGDIRQSIDKARGKP